ncbi:MAG: glycine cleavage system aminomethyltransferase GcvT [Verrucomicrobia bacterium]|nr:glycine cleavage system aminomethyltransferase GcvT [Verrucomicrobiota bacterium]
MLKRTPLFAVHQKLGARLVEFGGWEMPVQYSSIMDEHLAVRRAAGLFDISHMGEVRVSGPAALGFLNRTLTNDLRKLAPCHGQYTLMCNERGGVIDDLYAYRLAQDDFLLIINASRIEPDTAWLRRQFQAANPGNGDRFENVSDALGAVALQGPRAVEFIDECFPAITAGPTGVKRASELKKNQIGIFTFAGHSVYVARTGYTGEDGFEIIAATEIIAAIWERLMSAGHAHCLQPAGLGARDTLRTEACFPLYGHELDEETTLIEAGLGFFVALDKGEFIGRTVLADQKANGVAKKCVAFKMTEKSAPPRPGYPIWSSGSAAAPIGKVVSGTQSPTLGIGIGLGYVIPEFAKPDTMIGIEIRGRRSSAVVVQKPFYRKAN